MTLDHAAVAASVRVDQPWRQQAACAGRADVMDPPAKQVAAARDLGTEHLLWADAKAVCRTCPVLVQCRSWVITLPVRQDVTGVCGGLTEAERATERRRLGQLGVQPGVPEPEPPRPAAGRLLCTSCGETKPDDDFGRDKRMPGRRWRRSHCRVCTGKYWRDYAKRHR